MIYDNHKIRRSEKEMHTKVLHDVIAFLIYLMIWWCFHKVNWILHQKVKDKKEAKGNFTEWELIKFNFSRILTDWCIAIFIIQFFNGV